MCKKFLCLLLALITVSAFLLPALAAVEEEHDPYPDPIPAYDEADAVLLARLITAEAANQPFEGQVAVGNVVLNRLASGYWGDTVKRVVSVEFAKPKKNYTESCYRAAVAALTGTSVVPYYVTSFQRGRTKYHGGPWVVKIGAHNFYGSPEKFAWLQRHGKNKR